MHTDVWVLAMMQKETEPVGRDLLSIDFEGSVALALVSSPQPASVCFFDVCPKAFNAGILIHVNSYSVG
jgi:hypothetical protein